MSDYFNTLMQTHMRIARAGVIGALWKALNENGYTVTVSHDSGNASEKIVKSHGACCYYALDEELGTGRAWVFAYRNLKKGEALDVLKCEPTLWVLLHTDNEPADMIADYAPATADKVIAPAIIEAAKYE